MANLVAEYLSDILDCQEIVALLATADAFVCQIAFWDGTDRVRILANHAVAGALSAHRRD